MWIVLCAVVASKWTSRLCCCQLLYYGLHRLNVVSDWIWGVCGMLLTVTWDLCRLLLMYNYGPSWLLFCYCGFYSILQCSEVRFVLFYTLCISVIRPLASPAVLTCNFQRGSLRSLSRALGSKLPMLRGRVTPKFFHEYGNTCHMT